jgi:hypothetical protein
MSLALLGATPAGDLAKKGFANAKMRGARIQIREQV